jgi:DNA polymerase V
VHLNDYTDDVLQINRAVQSGLKRIYKAEHRYKKAGIVLLDIIPSNQHAPDLFFDTSQSDKRKHLSATLAKVNAAFGKDKLVLAPLISQQPRQWAMKQNHKSPSYLTKWEDVLRVG